MIMAALFLTVLLGFAGLAIDFGQAASISRAAQNAADDAAQTGGYEMYAGSSLSTARSMATTVAMSTLSQAGFNTTTNAITVTIRFLDQTGNDTTYANNVYNVQATITGASPTNLMRVLGVFSSPVGAQATVKVGPGSPQCVFCVLNSSNYKGALSLSGNGQGTVAGGAAIVDSSDPNAAAVITGNATFTAPYIGIVGGYQNTGQATFNNGGPGLPPATGVQSVPDPLARLQDPLSAGLCGTNQGSASVPSNSSLTLSPGTYGNISMSSSGSSLILQPGIYCLTGQFNVSGGTLTATGVTLYFTCGSASAPAACASGASGGYFSMSGGSASRLSAPTSGPYNGMTIFYDRNNTGVLKITGDSTASFSGTVYARSTSNFTLTGNGGSFQMNSMVVVNNVTVAGNGIVNVNYDPTLTYPVPMLPVFTQ